jgi:hypothetical protein
MRRFCRIDRARRQTVWFLSIVYSLERTSRFCPGFCPSQGSLRFGSTQKNGRQPILDPPSKITCGLTNSCRLGTARYKTDLCVLSLYEQRPGTCQNDRPEHRQTGKKYGGLRFCEAPPRKNQKPAQDAPRNHRSRIPGATDRGRRQPDSC